ncbi:MAG TPA: glutamate--tRNA ligase [Kofleriaceae bacterium]|nr:glutamate--tRNA ligase [Kofleriaceae bacterium]
MSAAPRPVRVRIAPSPTGDPHVGTAYIALFNYAFARKEGGTFVLRIEDTDQTRARADSERMIFEALRWVGLSWDEGPDVGGPHVPYRQSERAPIYREHAGILLERGAAYRCFCTEERLATLRASREGSGERGYDRYCRDLDPAEGARRAAAGEPHVVRLKMPLGGAIEFRDQLRKKPQRWDAAQMDDQVLLKSDGLPTYHLANVVDDHLMEITHVIRAEEWLSSTPKHEVLYRAFGWEPPQWFHMPLLRNADADKTKISKRKNPVSINYYRDAGILPQALLNFLGQMGWSFGDNREKFTLAEMIEVFSWDRISLGGPVFNLEKLMALNEKYLQEQSFEQLADLAIGWRLNREFLIRLMPLVQKRMKKLSDLIPLTEFFFAGDLDYAPVLAELTIPEVPAEDVAAGLRDFVERFEARDGWSAAQLDEVGKQWTEARGWKTKHAYTLLRLAITARRASPPLFETMEVLGKELVRRRLRQAADLIAPEAPAAKAK